MSSTLTLNLPLRCHFPPADTFLTHLVYSAILDELSNASPLLPHLQSHLYTKGWKKGPIPIKNTTQPLMFIHYQTGCHGAQNGGRLVIVEVDNDPDRVSVVLDELGRIERDTAEMVVFPRSGGEVFVVKDENGKVLDGSVLLTLFSCGFIQDVKMGDVVRYIRKNAIYPRDKGRDVGHLKEKIDGDIMFVVEGVLVIAKKGTNPEELVETLREALDCGKVKRGDAVVFGYSTEVIIRYDGLSGVEEQLAPPTVDPSSMKQLEPCNYCKELNAAMQISNRDPE